MTKAELMNNMNRTFHKIGFKLKKHSPEILVVTGTVGVVASAVMACKATTKAGAILEDAKQQLEGFQSVLETPELQEKYKAAYGEEYTEEELKKDSAIVYAQTGLKYIKLYGPSVLLGAASIGCIFASHNIIRKRNMALTAAYAVVDKGFKEYRGRVIERFGEELDRELKYNIKAKEIEEIVMNEDGTESVVKRTVEVADPNLTTSDYMKCFDETCTGWTRNAEDNLAFLRQQQAYANKKLQCEGYLFLNDVYEMLGIPKTKAGHVVGWIYDKNGTGDNYVDFGIYDLYDEQKRNFVNGYEKSIWLDFNVDGDIYELLY